VFGTMKAAHTGHHGRRGSAVPLLVVIVTLLAGACHPLARTSAPAPETLRVMTFNIRAGTDLERRPSIPRLAAFIDSVAPDLVFLQEVDRETRRSGGVDQLGELARLTGMHGAFGRAMGFDGGEYGTGILSRLPLRDTATLALPVELPPELSERYQEPRALLRATVDTPRGPLFLLGTHLDHHGHGFLREPQLLQILAHLAERVPGDAMVLFAGDLNAQPDAAEIRAVALAFHDAWLACGDPAREGRTYPCGPTDAADRLRVDEGRLVRRCRRAGYAALRSSTGGGGAGSRAGCVDSVMGAGCGGRGSGVGGRGCRSLRERSRAGSLSAADCRRR
jgi:endonuclease/exonuclease/phosphatase family metal-dependent hydrolase